MTAHINSISRPNFSSYLHAMMAIARKDWIVFWRYPLNAASQIFQPLIWLAPVFFMGQAFSSQGQALGFAGYSGTPDYMSFIILGSALTSFIGAVFWGMGFALKNDMDSGVLETNWMAPVPRMLILVGHTLTNMLVTLITTAGMVALAGLIFGFHPTGNVLGAILSAFPMLIGLYGFGFGFAALVLLIREANTLVDISNFLIQTFSGESFPVNSLPRGLLPIALALPTTYGLDLARGWLLNTHTLFPMKTEIGILLGSMLVLVLIGAWIFRWLERRVRILGTLGQH
jgi:ABC-2 type transport system permease protein